MANINFRKKILSSGLLALAGKNAENNEKLIARAGKNEYVLHTKAPGSPFVNIKAPSKEVSKKDLKEAAIFCAVYSQVWKKAKVKKDVEVHIFFGKDITKVLGMKTGTFGVSKIKTILIKREDIEKSENDAS